MKRSENGNRVRPRTMLPRKVLPDQDLILCASLNRTMMTTNVHPLYLPPVVCWLNRTSSQVRRVKRLIFTALKVISTVLILSTLFLHVLRLWNLFSWGLLGAMWSLMVCLTLTAGLSVTITSSDKRNDCCNTSVLADMTSLVSLGYKIATFVLFVATYTVTWLYYQLCGVTVIHSGPWLGCSDKVGSRLFPILEWTTFVFVWINTIGSVRLFCHS